jgi:hypothetical protein
MPQLIIVAFGIQFRSIDWPNTEKFLNANCDAKLGMTNTFTFPKGAGAKATYEIRIVFDLADFAKAIDTPDAVVIYDGHSRYGQGPAFGPATIGDLPDAKAFPTNPWGIHYRMGYDATDTECMGDLMHHSITPTEFDLTTASSTAFLGSALVNAAANAKANNKAIKAKKIKVSAICSTTGAWREFDTCEPTLANTATTRGDRPLKGRHYYARIPGKTVNEFLSAVTVGSVDLDKSKLPGKLLVMGSCSSHVHFFEALDRRRKTVKSSCKFILTSQVCTVDLATAFLKLVLINKIDPTTNKGMAKLAKKLNGESGSGLVGLY